MGPKSKARLHNLLFLGVLSIPIIVLIFFITHPQAQPIKKKVPVVTNTEYYNRIYTASRQEPFIRVVTRMRASISALRPSQAKTELEAYTKVIEDNYAEYLRLQKVFPTKP